MKKVVFLKVATRSCSSQLQPLPGRGDGGSSSGPHATALVLQRSADGFLTIQGRSPIAWSERHQCWQLFRKVAKGLLGVCEAVPVSVSFSEPPFSAVSDLGEVFRQPSHIVSLTLSPLPHESELERQADCRKDARIAAIAASSPTSQSWSQQQPSATPSGLYTPPSSRLSPLSSPLTRRRRAKTPGEERREMDKLLAGLDEVSQSLERTQSRCADIARRCPGPKPASRATGGEEELDWGGDDARVERLLRVAENLTVQIINKQHDQMKRSRSLSPSITGSVDGVPRQSLVMTSSSSSSEEERRGREEGVALPDCPSDVSVQPSVNGGALVFWRPLRLDERDRNNGCKVTGYVVHVDGVRRSKVTEPFGSHVEVDGMETGGTYKIQVRTMTNDGRQSSLTPAVQYRHEGRSSSLPPPPPSTSQQKKNQSTKVENWLLASSQSPSRPPLQTTERTRETTPTDHTQLSEDTWSMGSSHTSGIVMDHPPSSPKLTPSCPSFYHGDGFSVHSGATTLIIDGQTTSLSPYHHHQLRYSTAPSPSHSSSRSRSITPKEEGDVVIDEPLSFTTKEEEKEEEEETRAAATVRLVARGRQTGPAPPSNVIVTQKQPGWLHVSWTPAKRDEKGCSNGCYILGYRVYINEMPQLSMDGPMTYETSLRWPHFDPVIDNKIDIHIRTRSIAAESIPSTGGVYYNNTIVQKSLDKYSSSKVTSPLSSTTTLCPSNNSVNKTRPFRKPSPTPQGTVTKETFV